MDGLNEKESNAEWDKILGGDWELDLDRLPFGEELTDKPVSELVKSIDPEGLTDTHTAPVSNSSVAEDFVRASLWPTGTTTGTTTTAGGDFIWADSSGTWSDHVVDGRDQEIEELRRQIRQLKQPKPKKAKPKPPAPEPKRLFNLKHLKKK